MENLDAAPERDIRRRYVIGLVARELLDAVGRTTCRSTPRI